MLTTHPFSCLLPEVKILCDFPYYTVQPINDGRIKIEKDRFYWPIGYEPEQQRYITREAALVRAAKCMAENGSGTAAALLAISADYQGVEQFAAELFGLQPGPTFINANTGHTLKIWTRKNRDIPECSLLQNKMLTGSEAAQTGNVFTTTSYQDGFPACCGASIITRGDIGFPEETYAKFFALPSDTPYTPSSDKTVKLLDLGSVSLWCHLSTCKAKVEQKYNEEEYYEEYYEEDYMEEAP